MSNALLPKEGAARREEGAASTRALMNAVGAGDAAAVASLLASGAHADARLSNGETPLMRASARGYADVARTLLDAGADVNARRADGFTPLVLAVFFGHETLARLLLERGADATARTRLGTTAEGWAAARGFDEIAWVLRSYSHAGASLEGSRRAGETSSPAGRAALFEERARRDGATDEEVSIFSRKRSTEGARASVASAGAFTAASRGGVALASADATDAPSKRKTEAATSERKTKAATSEHKSEPVAASNFSVRSDGHVPAHPSASGLRLGAFMRSWQASVGTTLILLALGVAVFAIWRDGRRAPQSTRPAPTPQAAPTQLVSQPAPPAQSETAPQPSTLPTTDAQGGAVAPGMPGAAYTMPVTSGQPFYVPPPVVAPPSNLPKEPTVISESDSPSNQNGSKTKNKPDARDASSGASSNGAAREEQGRSDTAPPDSTGRSAQQTAPPQTNQPARTSPPPAPASTPERGKVIQWPPQLDDEYEL